MHNGVVREFSRIRRELLLAVDESLFQSIEGTTDSEAMFYLALSFGLEDEPITAVERMVGLIEEVGHAHGVEDPIQMTIATTDGRSIWAFRYSSEGDSRSLYFSTRMDTLKALYPDAVELAGLSDETRVVVSEPLGDLPGVWNEVRRLMSGSSGRETTSCCRSRLGELRDSMSADSKLGAAKGDRARRICSSSPRSSWPAPSRACWAGTSAAGSVLWDTITAISIEYIVAAVIAGTVKTTATAYACTGSSATPIRARFSSGWYGPPMPRASR
jgi:hypothetical protein